MLVIVYYLIFQLSFPKAIFKVKLIHLYVKCKTHNINNIINQERNEGILLLYTKNVHFTFNGQIYIQVDGVAMRSPVALLLTNIFMIELERSLIPIFKK